MTEDTSVCGNATSQYPNGRTGTTAGYNAHLYAGERSCPACAEARNEYRRAKSLTYQEKIFWDKHPACFRPTKKYPGGRIGTTAGYQAHALRGETACDACLRAQTVKSLDHRYASEDRLAQHRASNGKAAKSWRERNPEKARQTKQQTIDKNRTAVRSAKDKPCTDCGVRYPYYVMEFDHIDPDTKEFNVSAGVMSASYERLIVEIAKCEVVCANCHAERTHQRRQRRKEATANAFDQACGGTPSEAGSTRAAAS